MSLTTATGPLIDQPVPFGPVHFYSGDTGSFVLVIATTAPSDLTVKVYPRRSTVANLALTPTLVAITGSPNKRVQFTAEQTAVMLNETMACLIYFDGQNQYKADITATLDAKGKFPSTEVSIVIDTRLADITAAVLTAQSIVSNMNPVNRVIDQTPIGLVNGVNTVFTLVDAPNAGTVTVYISGHRLTVGAGNDFTIAGAVLTITPAPLTGETVKTDYIKI